MMLNADVVGLVCRDLSVPDRVSLSAVCRSTNGAVKQHRDAHLMLVLLSCNEHVLAGSAAWTKLHLFGTRADVLPMIGIVNGGLLLLWPHRLLRVRLDRLGASIVWSQDLYEQHQRPSRMLQGLGIELPRPPTPIGLVLATAHVYVMVCVSVPWHRHECWSCVLELWQFDLGDGASRKVGSEMLRGKDPCSCAMIFHDGCVFAFIQQYRGSLWCFDTRTEQSRWISAGKLYGMMGQVSLAVQGKMLAVACGKWLHLHKKRTGQFVELQSAPSDDPVFVLPTEDAVVCGSKPLRDTLEVQCIHGGAERWSRKWSVQHQAVACVQGGHLFLALPCATKTHVLQLDVATGRKTSGWALPEQRVRLMTADRTHLVVVSGPCVYRFALQ